MVSSAAGDTLTITLVGSTFGVAHDLAGADYSIKIGGANYVDVDCSSIPVYCKTGYSNESYKIIIKAADAGVKIKGFYESPMTIADPESEDGKVGATVLNSHLNTNAGDTAYAMAVYYDANNRFVSFAPITMTTAANANNAVIEAEAPQEAVKAKILIWKSLESLTPLCNATDFITIN